MTEQKLQLLDLLCRQIKNDIALLEKQTEQARLAAIDPDSKQESKYDTRALEASYLARGQANQLAKMHMDLVKLQKLTVLNQLPSQFDSLEAGHLVVLTNAETMEDQTYFLLPAFGGFEIPSEPRIITTLATHSSLGQALLTQSIGHSLNDGRYVSEIY